MLKMIAEGKSHEDSYRVAESKQSRWKRTEGSRRNVFWKKVALIGYLNYRKPYRKVINRAAKTSRNT